MSSAVRVYNYMLPRMTSLETEEFWVLFLNQNSKLIQAKRVSSGGISEVLVDIRVIMKEAVLCNATAVIACHNHPSGSLRPSKHDDELTLSIKKACDVMRLRMIDHIIIVDGNYYSYREQGKL